MKTHKPNFEDDRTNDDLIHAIPLLQKKIALYNCSTSVIYSLLVMSVSMEKNAFKLLEVRAVNGTFCCMRFSEWMYYWILALEYKSRSG